MTRPREDDASIGQVIVALARLVRDVENVVEDIETTIAKEISCDLDSASLMTVQRIDFVRQSMHDLYLFLNALGEDANLADLDMQQNYQRHLSILKLQSSRNALSINGNSADPAPDGSIDFF